MLQQVHKKRLPRVGDLCLTKQKGFFSHMVVCRVFCFFFSGSQFPCLQEPGNACLPERHGESGYTAFEYQLSRVLCAMQLNLRPLRFGILSLLLQKQLFVTFLLGTQNDSCDGSTGVASSVSLRLRGACTQECGSHSSLLSSPSRLLYLLHPFYHRSHPPPHLPTPGSG